MPTTSLSRSHIFGLRVAIATFLLLVAWPLVRPLVVTSLLSRSDLYGKYGDAQRYIARAALIDPSNPRLVASQAFASLADGPKAMKAERDILLPIAQTQPENGELWLDLAIMDARLKDYPAAGVAIDNALRTRHDPTTQQFADVLHARR